MIKETVQQEDKTMLIMYTHQTLGYPNKASIKSKGRDSDTTKIVGEFDNPLSAMHRLPRQKNQQRIIRFKLNFKWKRPESICRTFHPVATEHILFSTTSGAFSRRDHILGHKTSLNQLKEIEILSNILSGHDAIKTSISTGRNFRNCTNVWKLNSLFLSNHSHWRN